MTTLDIGSAAAVLPEVRVVGAGDGAIVSLVHDSRAVVPGSLFAAIPGTVVDGHRFVPDALRAGAVAVLLERLPGEPPPPGVTYLQVPDARRALARLASRFHGEPSAAMAVCGITGTNGKTTITYVLEAILRAAGREAGVIGTTGIRYAGNDLGTTHTTPEGTDLHRTLGEMARAGVDAVVLELSSHGLEQGRAAGLQLDVAVFTNLSRDHLDFHGDMERYFAAKRRIVTELLEDSPKADRRLVVNVDDPRGPELAGRWPDTLRVSVAGDAGADLRVLDAEFDLDGFRARLESPDGPLALASPLLGAFNLSNVALAAAAAQALGLPRAAIEDGVAALRRVPGRLEPVDLSATSLGERIHPRVVVDYAHTPDALAHVLGALRPLVPGALWTVFGCGGDRDRGKRPLMGRAAAEGSDRLVVTSDNPRGEDPDAIIAEILPGIAAVGTPHRIEPDRRAAIFTAIASAGDDDLVLVAGKGHEREQVIGTRRLPFSDRRVAREALRAREER